MIEIQNIPIPLSLEQKKFSKSLRDVFMDNLHGRMMVQTDFSAIEVRIVAMCDPIYSLQRLNKKKSAAASKKNDNRVKQNLCICSHDIVIYQGCKCGGK